MDVAFPTLSLVALFGYSVFADYADAVLHEDLSDRLISVTTVSGRSPFDTATPPGQAVFTFDNSDRALDPFNYPGPYANMLVPGVVLVLKATDPTTSTTYDVWAGYAVEWPQNVVAGETSVTVEAVDALGLLAAAHIRDTSAWAYMIRQTWPLAWYRLGEGSGTRMRDSSPYRRHGYYMGGEPEWRESLVAGDESGSVGFNALTQWGRAIDNRPNDLFLSIGSRPNRTRTIEFWFKGKPRTDNPVLEFNLVTIGRNTEADVMGVVWDDFYGGLCLRAPGQPERVVTGVNWGDITEARHILFGFDRSTNTRQIYVDGIARSTALTGRTPTYRANGGIRVGDAIRGVGDDVTTSLAIDEVAIWGVMPTGLTVAPLDRYNIGAGTEGHQQRERMVQLGLMGGVGAAIDVDHTPDPLSRQLVLGPADYNQDLLALAQEVEAGEQGRLVTHLHTTPFGEDVPQLVVTGRDDQEVFQLWDFTFSDDETQPDFRYEFLEVDSGVSSLANTVVVTYPHGDGSTGSVSVTNESAVITDGPTAPFEVATQLTADDAEYLADYMLDRLDFRRPRITSMVLNPAAYPELVPVALGMFIGAKVLVSFKPHNTGNLVSVSSVVSGITHEMDEGSNVWTVTINFEPGPNAGGGVGAYYARWDDAHFLWDEMYSFPTRWSM